MAALSLLFLGGGYLASQVAAEQGNQSVFAAQMDQPAVRMVALVLFVCAISLAFARPSEGGE